MITWYKYSLLKPFAYAIFIHVQILGDSGGPLVVKNMDNCNTAVLLGVVRYRFLPIIINLKLNLYNINTKINLVFVFLSWGIECGVEGRPGVYTDVSYFLNEPSKWLCKALGLSPCPTIK